MQRLLSLLVLLGGVIPSGCIVLTDPGSFEGGDGGVVDGFTPDTLDAAPDADTSVCPTVCTGDRPVCNEITMDCVQCVEHSDCANPDRSICLDETCVECESPSDCTTATAPVCDTEGTEAGTCVPCAGSEDCGGIMDGSIALAFCETSGIEGVCVECTEDTAIDDCGEFSCNPATNRCTETRRANVDSCGACVSDTECKTEHGCVVVEFGGEARGSYCLPLLPASTICPRSYQNLLANVSTVSGTALASYCSVPTSTTCEALLTLGRSCAAEACEDGGRCEFITGRGDVCTIGCSGVSDCPAEGSFATCSTFCR